MSWRDWWKVLKRTWAEAGDDNIGLIAAGTAFYGFAAIVPLLASVVLEVPATTPLKELAPPPPAPDPLLVLTM